MCHQKAWIHPFWLVKPQICNLTDWVSPIRPTLFPQTAMYAVCFPPQFTGFSRELCRYVLKLYPTNSWGTLLPCWYHARLISAYLVIGKAGVIPCTRPYPTLNSSSTRFYSEAEWYTCERWSPYSTYTLASSATKHNFSRDKWFEELLQTQSTLWRSSGETRAHEHYDGVTCNK